MDNPAQYEHNRFVVNGYILGFSETKANKLIKKMDENGKVYDLSDDTSKVKGNVSHIYHMIMFVKDQSIENVDRFLNVYILTNEADQNIFDLWGVLPKADDSQSWANLDSGKLTEFEGKLKTLNSPTAKVKLVVELLMTNAGKPFLKLYDTVFLP